MCGNRSLLGQNFALKAISDMSVPVEDNLRIYSIYNRTVVLRQTPAIGINISIAPCALSGPKRISSTLTDQSSTLYVKLVR
jgi:hypothetical protein